MAVPAAVLSILVQANTGGATRGLMRFNSQLGATEAKSSRALLAVKTLAKGSAVATGIGLGYAVKKAADFEQQLDSLGSVSDASGKQMERFRRQAMKAGADTKFSALDAAVAQTELAKGGLKVKQIMRGGLAAALSLAAAGEMELGEAAATTANALNLFGLEGKSSMKVADALAKAANATTADVTDFAMALRQSGGVAKTAGLSFTETVLALEALANAGTKNSDAGTSLKTALLQLIGPTAKQKTLQKELGLEFINSAGGMKSMTQISTMLRGALDGMGAAQRAATLKVLAGTDGVRTLTALYDAGPEKLDKWRKGLQQSGTAADVAAQKQDNLKGKLENLQGSVETIAIGLGSKLLPGLTKFAEKTTKILNDPKLTGGEKFARFMEMVTQAMEKAAPVAAAAGVKIAGALASGLARGWREMNPLMKLFTAAAVIRLVGGRGALLKSGVAIGTSIGAGVSAGAAGAAAGGGAAAAGGGMIAAMRSKVLPVAKRLGLAGVGIALADVVISEFGRRSAAKSSDMFTALRASMGKTNAGGGLVKDLFGSDTEVLGVKGLNLFGDAMLKNSEIAARRLAPALEAIQKSQRGIGHERAAALRKEIGRLDETTPEARRALRGLVDGFEKTGQSAKAVQSQIHRMAEGSSGSISQLRTNVKLNTRLIRNALGEDTAAGRRAMSENFRAAIKNVKQSMKEGMITTGEGTREIQRLMTQSLSSMGFTKAQILHIKGSTRSLKGQKPSEVRGDQRGGPIMEGRPSGDSVPSMLERGEYVMNRNAVRKVGRKTLDKINFGMAPRFQKGGFAGMVGAANRVDKAGFPYSWGGGHQASPAPWGPFDCSGAVSYVLQKGGVNVPTMVSGSMMGIGKPGAGQVTVYANPGHVFMSILGKFFGTSGSNPGGGAGWFPDPGDAYKSGFTKRHFGTDDVGAVMGAAKMIKRLEVDGPDSMLKANVQGALDVARAGANKKLRSLALPDPIGAGDAGDPGPVGNWKGGNTLKFGQRLADKFGLSISSTYRTPAHNAAVGGVSNSMHTHGSTANPGAIDYVPPSNAAAAYARKAGVPEVLIHDAGSGLHLHTGFFQKGGLAEKLLQGGAVAGADESRMREYKRLLILANRKHGRPTPSIGAGLIDVESGWDPSAVSPAGAFGITQFMPGTAPGYGVQQGTSHGAVSSQIFGMAKFLKAMGGDIRTALAKYNGGPGNPQFGYADDVLAAAKKYPPSSFEGIMPGGPGAGSDPPKNGGGTGPQKIGKLAYVGDSLGVGTLGAGLKKKLGKINLASSVSGGKTSSWGVDHLKGLLGGAGAAMLDMGTNDGTVANLRPSISAVKGMLKGRPLMMASLDPQSTDVAKKNAAIRSMADVVIPWAGQAQKFASDKVHPTGAGYSKRASMIAQAAKGLRTAGTDKSGLTEREKKELKTPLKGKLGKVLTKTLKVLRSNKPAKFRGTRLKQLEKRIKAMDVGLPEGMRKQISNLRGNIEEVGEYADRASSLSTDNDDGTTSLGVIKGKTEAGWITDQLDMLFRLRNKLVDAKKTLEKHRAEIQKLVERMQKRLKELSENIRAGAKAKNTAERELKQLQKHPKQNKEAIKRHKATIERIDGLQSDRIRERDAISDKIIPALTGKRKQFTTYINEHIMGSDGLPQIQGLGSPLEKLSSLPAVGVLGGDIFDAQIRLRELAAPATSITDSADSETSESAELLKQLLREANLRTAVSQKQYEVLRNMPPYGGQFATGGVVPGPIGAARTIVAHGGETVTPPGNGSAPNIQINLGPGMEWLDKFIEVKVDGVTRKQARSAGRMLPGRGGGS